MKQQFLFLLEVEESNDLNKAEQPHLKTSLMLLARSNDVVCTSGLATSYADSDPADTRDQGFERETIGKKDSKEHKHDSSKIVEVKEAIFIKGQC